MGTLPNIRFEDDPPPPQVREPHRGTWAITADGNHFYDVLTDCFWERWNNSWLTTAEAARNVELKPNVPDSIRDKAKVRIFDDGTWATILKSDNGGTGLNG
jgi:hypothetical protein